MFCIRLDGVLWKRLEFSKILHERLSADKLGNQDPYMIEETLQ